MVSFCVIFTCYVCLIGEGILGAPNVAKLDVLHNLCLLALGIIEKITEMLSLP